MKRRPDPQRGGEDSGEQRADGHHRERNRPCRRDDPAEYARRDVGLYEAVDDHVPDGDDTARAYQRRTGEREPRSLVREREQQREAQTARDGDEHGPRCAEPSSQWAGDKCAEDAANAEAGHDEAGRCRGQPDSTDQEDDEEGVDTGECQVGER